MEKRLKNIKFVAVLAMLVSISIIAGKYLAIRGGDVMRFSLENMPVIFAGMGFGPVAGALVGLVADLVGCLLVGYAINPMVTLGAVVIGAISGLVPLLFKKRKKEWLITAITVATAHLFGSVIIKTIGLSIYYSMPFTVLLLWRGLNYLIVGIVDGMIVHILLGNKGILHQIKRLNPKSKMTYTQAIEYIHSVSNFFCKPGLERIKELCEGLGNPQNSLRFIHIGGTNGKGSVCAMLNSVLCEAGYKVGLYTSPYVREFNERMRVNGRNIPNDTLARLTEKVKRVADKMTDSPTEFELITAIAFEYFKEEKCNIVILEVGMGGRLDATNVISKPDLAIITGIALDHVSYLGDTVEKIAYEKAGIIKENTITLWGGDNESCEAIIRAECDKKQSLLCKTDYSKLKIDSLNLGGTVFCYRNRSNIKLSLLGSYQPRNAAIVLDALDNLSGLGLKVSDKDIRRGLNNAKWPARFEIINQNPGIIFDGAHNAQGIDAAVKSAKEYFGDKKLVILSGVLRDKDYIKIAECISSISDRVFTITPDNPRALSSEDYAKIYRELGVEATACDSIESALRGGMKAAIDEETVLLCLGSLYTYGDIVNLLEK